MLRQFVELKIRAYDPDDLTLRQLETCSLQMQELALDTNPHNVEHVFSPMPGIRLERVVSIQTMETYHGIDERKRITLTIFIKYAIHIDEVSKTQMTFDSTCKV
jgi:hypothetical protein